MRPFGTSADHLVHAGAKADDLAVGRDQRVRHLAFGGDAGVFHLMPRFAMHRHGKLRTRPLIKLDQFLLRGMARDMHRRMIGGKNVEPARDEPVLQARNGFFVAGNIARGENHRIARIELDLGMILDRDAPQGRARLALAAGRR